MGGIQEYRYYNEEGTRGASRRTSSMQNPATGLSSMKPAQRRKPLPLVTVAENDGKSLCVEKTDSLDNPVGLDELRASPGLANKGVLVEPSR